MNTLPKYIIKKIEQQNKYVYEAKRLELEIKHWCEMSGIDPYSDDFAEIEPQLEDAVGPIYKEGLERLYKKVNS